MRILLVHNRYEIKGGEDVVFDTQREMLGSLGHEVLVFESANQGGLAGATQFAMSPWNPFAARELARFARDTRPDVAHVHNTWFSMSPSVVRSLKRLGIPIVMTLHNYRLVCANALLYRNGSPCSLCVGRSPLPGIRYRCYRGVAGSAMSAATIQSWRTSGVLDHDVLAFVVFSESARELMISGGLPAEKLRVIPSATPDPGRRIEPPSESKTVLFVGRLSEEKGILDLVKSWGEIGRGLKLTVAGDGPLRKDVWSAATGNVEFIGQRDREMVQELMLASRCLFMPSKTQETLGLVILEALGASLPVMTTGMVPMARAVEETGAGWILDGPETWSSAIEECLDDASIDVRSSKARHLYMEQFRPSVMIEALEDLYESVAEGGT